MKPPPGHALHLTLGLTLWSGWLVLMYGALSVGCVLAPPGAEQGPLNTINAALALLTLATSAGLLGYARACWRAAGRGTTHHDPRQRFIPTVGAALHLAAALATLFVGLPLAGLAPCV